MPEEDKLRFEEFLREKDEKVKDPEASKPDGWDDDEDGEWEAPMIDNPDYKGAWRAKRIDNPAYKGEWKAKQLDNPDFVKDVYGYSGFWDLAGHCELLRHSD